MAASLRSFALALAALMFAVGSVAAQTAPPRSAPPSPSATTMVFVHVKSVAGRAMPGVTLLVTGATTGKFSTDLEGTIRLPSIRDGVYHLRFVKEGFGSVERELNVRRGLPDVVDVVLKEGNGDAVVPGEPPPLPAPAAIAPSQSTPSLTTRSGSAESMPPPATEARASASAPRPAALGEEKTVSITTFLEKNFIGREPFKESVLSCTATARTRLLQLREGFAEHAHDNDDETLYVVAGEGVVLVRDHAATPIVPASLTTIPKGVPHRIERRGKNPLILVSTLSGTPCSQTSPAAKE